MREASVTRNTAETQISLWIDLDGSGKSEIDTGIGFLDHMLTLFSRHGRFDMKLKCAGDLRVDGHHTTEDAAIVLGRAFDKALGGRAGIARYGCMTLPMDEALILAAVDICGRATLGCSLSIPSPKVGDFDTELTQEFFMGFARSLGAAVHIRQLAGDNSHHIIEGAFKAFAIAMRQAVTRDEGHADEIPSTKGTIDRT